ncbi:MAG: V-type ATPase subunit [Candidatus Helarchaeota archaeon]
MFPISELGNLARSLDLPTFKQRITKFFPDLHKKIFPDLDSIHAYLRDDQIYTNWKIIKNSPNSVYEFLRAFFLLEFEVENLKTVIKSKLKKVEFENIKKDVYMSIENILGHEKIFDLFINSIDLSMSFDAFRNTLYYKALKDAEKYYEEYHSLSFYDIFLDYCLVEHVFKLFNKLKSKEKKVVKKHVDLFLNFYNFKTLIRGSYLGFEPEFIKKVLIMNEPFIKRLVGINDINKIAQEVSNRLKLPKIFKEYKKNDLESILTLLRHYYHKKSLEIIKKWEGKDVFCITSPYAFLLKKRFETEDLKFISIGIEYELNPDEIIKNSILIKN